MATVYYRGDGIWEASNLPPWGRRPMAENFWAAVAAAAWANHQEPKLEWSERERVFEKLRRYDADIKAGHNIPWFEP